jgi:hypothetical protein
MRHFLIKAIALCFVATTAGAQSEPPLPDGAAALEAKLMTRVGPQTRGWIKQEAARQNAAGNASEVSVRSAIMTNPSFSGFPEGDINALTFLVMMEASRSARDDLKGIMSDLKQINEAKASLSKKSQASVGTSVSPKPTTVKAASGPVQPTPIPKAEFAKKLQSASNNMDSLSEMGEMESLRLQKTMDKVSKSAAMISSVMKKQSETSQSITQNLK